MITKQALAASIKELMEREPLSKISVGDITSNCGVNRQTFYYHFKDKYELVNWIYYTETVKLMSRLFRPRPLDRRPGRASAATCGTTSAFTSTL